MLFRGNKCNEGCRIFANEEWQAVEPNECIRVLLPAHCREYEIKVEGSFVSLNV